MAIRISYPPSAPEGPRGIRDGAATGKGAAWIALLLAAGCAATSDPGTGDPAADLHHRDPRVRMEAVHRAAVSSRTDLLPELVASLRDRDPSVRFFAGIALRRLTGEDLGFLSYGSAGEREEAVARWELWVATRTSPDGGAKAPSGGFSGAPSGEGHGEESTSAAASSPSAPGGRG